MADTTSITISTAAGEQLDALAERLGVTRRQAAERLITGGGATEQEDDDATGD